MPKSFRVEVRATAREEGDRGVPYLVFVRPFGISRVVGELRVDQFEDDGVSRLRLVWARLQGVDPTSPIQGALTDARWWSRALDDVLEEVTFVSTAVDQAVDALGGRLRFGWVGGDVREVQLIPADSDATVDRIERPAGSSGPSDLPMHWMLDIISAARRQVAMDAELTEEVLESFFTDLAMFLAEKAFDRDDEGPDDGPAEPD